MAQWAAGFGGTYGGQFRIYTQADIVQQDEDNNRTLISYSSWVDRVSSSGAHLWNNYNTYGHTNINGYNPQRGPYHYDTTGTGRIITMASGEQYWIGHDSNGNANPYFASDYDPANSPYWTGGSSGGNYQLPQLYLYAAPNAIYFPTVTDTRIDFRVVTNRVVDNIAVSIDGGGWIYFSGSTTDRTMSFTGLKSGNQYRFHISLRRQSSGYWQEHGDWYATTAVQNKFFDIGDF